MKKILNILGIIGLTVTSTTPLISCYIKKHDKEDSIEDKTYVNANIAKQLENRGYAHSAFKPTGYFLKAETTYKITLNRKVTNEEAEDVKLIIGQWGNYKNPIIMQDDNTFSNYDLSSNKQIVLLIPQNPGVLYLADNNQTDLQVIDITTSNLNNLIKIPTFKINATKQDNFKQEIATTNSPFVELVSKHYLATLQTNRMKNILSPSQENDFLNNALTKWDQTWDWTNEIYGLKEDMTDINKKHSQYIHIANPDKGGGLASASNSYLSFHNGASKELFIKNQWTLWHETGHTYQTPQYGWKNLGEVTVNISALYIQQKKGTRLRIFTNPTLQKEIKTYFAIPAQEKEFNQIGGGNVLWIKLAMFWQLQMAFGDNFYPLLNQRYRLINQESNSGFSFNTNDKKIQAFIKITSEVTGYNLIRFYEQWGLWPTTDTKNSINNLKLKKLTKEIWNNIIDPTTEKNPIVQDRLQMLPLSDLSKIKAKDVIVNFSQDYNTKKGVNELFNLPNALTINELKVYSNYKFFGTKTKYVNVALKLSEKNKAPNIKVFKFKVNLNNTIMFQGMGDETPNTYKGIMGLDPKTHHIKFYGSTSKIHYNFNNKIYYDIIIKNKNGILIKLLKITGDQSWQKIIYQENLIDGIPYLPNDDYTITIIPKEGKRVRIYDKGEYKSLNGPKTYLIKNDTLIEV